MKKQLFHLFNDITTTAVLYMTIKQFDMNDIDMPYWFIKSGYIPKIYSLHEIVITDIIIIFINICLNVINIYSFCIQFNEQNKGY